MNSSITIPHTIAGGIYPERDEPRISKSDRLAAAIGGIFAPWFRPRAERFSWIVDAVHSHASDMKRLNDQQILALGQDLRKRLRHEGFQDDLVARSFALVREVAGRTVGMQHRDVQLIGGVVLLNGMVAEMETGEGKTLTATLPACTLALAGIAVHIITVNDYLAQRDTEWMGPIYRALGLSVGTIIHGIDPAIRRDAYRCDITYCTNKEVTFDYLRDRIVMWDRPSSIRLQLERLYGENSRINKLAMRGLHFAIVDEADSVLIDEARTPLIISSEAEGMHDPGVYQHVMVIAKELVRGKDFSIVVSDRTVELTNPGKKRIADFEWPELGISLNVQQREELVRQALVALYLFDLDKHYLIKDGKVQIIDEYTGRLMADRSWERGLHQLIEVKEGCEITQRKDTRARISYQRFFRRYLRLAGMTGTAREVAAELWSIYRIRVVSIPTYKPLQRHFLPNRIYSSAEQKWTGIVKTISDLQQKGRPVLVGTRSVEASEHLDQLLEDAGMTHSVLNARQDKEEAEIVAQAGQQGRITVATNMAGRGTDILLGSGVAELKGLHVIATEHHEAGRIDRQLFGRCGRQGDPGSCETIVSLDDELIEFYTSKLLRWLAIAFLKSPRGILTRCFGKIIFHRAQRAAERQHSRMRHDLLKFDEQISDSLAFTGRLE
jgi:preprotein translocase subunit SecA